MGNLNRKGRNISSEKCLLCNLVWTSLRKRVNFGEWMAQKKRSGTLGCRRLGPGMLLLTVAGDTVPHLTQSTT